MESKLSLNPVGTKEKAKSIVAKFNEHDYFYVSLKCKGISKLTPSILRKVFPNFEFSWSNIFVNGSGKSSLSGTVIIDIGLMDKMYQLLEFTDGHFINKGMTVRYKIICYNDFKSAVMNCRNTSSYRIETKSSPESKSNNREPQKVATTVKVKKLNGNSKNPQPSAASNTKMKQSAPTGTTTQSKQSKNTNKSKQPTEKDKSKSTNTGEPSKRISAVPQSNQHDEVNLKSSSTKSLNNRDIHQPNIPLRVNKILQANASLLPVTRHSSNVKIKREEDQMVVDEPACLVIDEEASGDRGSPMPMEVDDRFIPITSQTLRYALKLLDKLNTRRRTIYVVYHPMFRDSRINMTFVREILEPVFDEIETDSVFIKSSLTMLEPTLEEAYSKNFSLSGLAYIISNENLCKNTLAIKANEHKILYGTMTLSCLLTSINKGNYLMSREALMSLGAPIETVTAKYHY